MMSAKSELIGAYNSRLEAQGAVIRLKFAHFDIAQLVVSTDEQTNCTRVTCGRPQGEAQKARDILDRAPSGIFNFRRIPNC